MPEIPPAGRGLLLDLQVGQQEEDDAEGQAQPDAEHDRHVHTGQAGRQHQRRAEDQPADAEQHLGGQEDLQGATGQRQAGAHRGELQALRRANPLQPPAKLSAQAVVGAAPGRGPVPVAAPPRRVKLGELAGQPGPWRAQRVPQQEQPEAGQRAKDERTGHCAPPRQAATASGISSGVCGAPAASSRSGAGNRASARIHMMPSAYRAATTASTTWPARLS